MLPWPRVGGALSGALVGSIARARAGVKRERVAGSQRGPTEEHLNSPGRVPGSRFILMFSRQSAVAPLLLLLCLVPLEAQRPDSVTVNLSVQEAMGMVQGFLVRSEGRSASTDANGTARLVLPAGQRTLDVTHIGFIPKRVSVNTRAVGPHAARRRAHLDHHAVGVHTAPRHASNRSSALKLGRAIQRGEHDPRRRDLSRPRDGRRSAVSNRESRRQTARARRGCLFTARSTACEPRWQWEWMSTR